MITTIFDFIALNAGVLAAVMLSELLFYRLGRSFEPRWHPVVAFGGLISWVERLLNDAGLTKDVRRRRGLWAWLVLVGLADGLGVLAFVFLPAWAYALMFFALGLILVAFSTLAQFVGRVADGLDQSGVSGGREAVAHIVGRDPEALDEAGISRAAIESLAENFSDGVTAPLFWGLIFGLPGLLAYKAVNTLDSMWGYRNDRFEDFGKASARLDDAINWIPARLTGALVCLVAGGGWRVMAEAAPRHRSPNAGWPEAAFAAGLDLSLAGPRKYDTGWSDDPPMGTGRRALNSGDIRRALALYFRCGVVMTAVVAGLLLLTLL